MLSTRSYIIGTVCSYKSLLPEWACEVYIRKENLRSHGILRTAEGEEKLPLADIQLPRPEKVPSRADTLYPYSIISNI